MKKRTTKALRKRKAYEHLKERILSDQLKAGEALLEDELATQFDLSRTPVREILTQLSHERLVKRSPYMGTYVTQITREDVREIYEIRGALESLAVQAAVIRISEHELEDLEQVFDQASQEIEHGCTNSAVGEFRKIHDLIIANADNPRLQTYLRSLDSESGRILAIATASPDYDAKPGLDEKREILLALRDRDTERAAQLIVWHYKSSIHRLVRFFPDRSSVAEILTTFARPPFL
jgi:DNA-binding GntR family transcriptional regulator